MCVHSYGLSCGVNEIGPIGIFRRIVVEEFLTEKDREKIRISKESLRRICVWVRRYRPESGEVFRFRGVALPIRVIAI